ncbi:hypothetical protein CDIK_0119 [Cucumispora dikerogammari]|nr:hypothetical protein CDIK_0119 [Cucumispora dikerogammari]
MFLLNQSFLLLLKQIVYNFCILNQHIYSLECSQQNEQAVEDFRLALNRINEIIEELKMLEHQSNNRNENSLLAEDQEQEHITPVTYITETIQKRYENTIVDYPPNNDNIFISKQNNQQANGDPFFYIEDTMVDTGDVFSNTAECFEQTDTIQSLAADNSEQLYKRIDCTPVSPSFYQNNNFETLNNLTVSSFETFSPVKKLVSEQPGKFNFSLPNEKDLYYSGKFEIEEQNLLTNHQTPQEKDVYEKQRLQSKTKRPSKEIDGVPEPSDKKPKFNNEDKNKKFLIQNSIIGDRQNQLNIPVNDNHDINSNYTVTNEHSNAHKQHKPNTYQTIGANSNQTLEQIGQDFCQNTVCTSPNSTITNSQISIQRTQNNKNIRTEFRLSSDQKDANIFKEIQEIETNTNITACYIKVPENTHVYGVREPTPCVKSDFIVNVNIFPSKNGQTEMLFFVWRVPMFLCAVSSVYLVDLEYRMDRLPGHTFFVGIKITIIRPKVANLRVFDILPKFTFISKKDYVRTDFYVNKIYALRILNAEFEGNSLKKTYYSDNQHKKKTLEGKLSKTHEVKHILLTLEVHKKAVENEKHTDPYLNNAIKKLELLQSHLDKISDVFIIEEEDFKRQLSQIIEFNKNFCKEENSAETAETGTPKAKNLKRAFLKALAWFKRYKRTFIDFYDIF